MNAILAPLLGGVLGTAAMSLLLWLPVWLGLPRVDLVRAMGAYITGDRERAFVPGIIIHFIVGIVFGYVYYWGFHFTLVPLTPLHGLFAGAVHGTLIMLFVSIAVLEHHPNKRYQRRGPMTGFAQLIGHIVYGVIVGTVCYHLAPDNVTANPPHKSAQSNPGSAALRGTCLVELAFPLPFLDGREPAPQHVFRDHAGKHEI